MGKRSLDFPNKKELRNSNSIEFKVFIPSTRDYNKKIGQSAFNKRVNEAVTLFSKMFGGSTIDVEQGSYIMNGKTIKEKVAVITVSAKPSDYNRYDEDIEQWLKNKKKSWGQDSMGFTYQGKMIFV